MRILQLLAAHMTRRAWRSIAALGALAVSLPAAAFDISDHWWSAPESGWGMSVVQQHDTAFVALFVYGNDGQPGWFTAAMKRGGTDASGNPFFLGALYRTSGPWFGTTFDSTKVQYARVGSIALSSHGANTASVEYDVDGAAVVKNVTRLTFRLRNWTGTFHAVQRMNYRQCAVDMPASMLDDGIVDVKHIGEAFAMTWTGGKSSCSYAGTYSQAGRIGSATGDYACSDGASGRFKLTRLEENSLAFAARVEQSHATCASAWQEIAGFSTDRSSP